VLPDFALVEEFEGRPHISHGNLKQDGIERVWRHVLEVEVPAMPEPEELAQRYGDLTSEAMHPAAGSVYRLLADRHWRKQEGGA